MNIETIIMTEKSCPITCDSINIKLKLLCGHEFEHLAIQEWLQQKGTCPVCRHKICLDETYTNEINEFILSLNDKDKKTFGKVLSDFELRKKICKKIKLLHERSDLIHFSYCYNMARYTEKYFNPFGHSDMYIKVGKLYIESSIPVLLFCKWLIEINFMDFLRVYG